MKICGYCGQECDGTIEDNSYDDEFGTVFEYEVVSECCKDEVVEVDDEH